MKPTIMHFIINIGMCSTLLFVSCSQCNNLPSDSEKNEPIALKIVSAKLNFSQQEVISRATESEELKAGSIGVFRSKTTGSNQAQDNKHYFFSSLKGWQPLTTDQTVFLMANDADICAYYPYNSAYTEKKAIPLESGKYKGTPNDLTKYDPADLCYAVNRSTNGANPSVQLEMNHAMSMVQIRLQRSDLETTVRTLTSVNIENQDLPSNATLDITNGTYVISTKKGLTWTPGTNEPATGINLPAGGVSETTSALLIPCTFHPSGVIFNFIISNKMMTVNVPISKLPRLQAGKIHRLIFDIKATTAILKDISIIDWWREWNTADEPELGTNSKEYIDLAGTKWALSNLQYNTAFQNYHFSLAATDMGTKMRWNALTNTDSGNATTVWMVQNDPCARLEPKGTWVSPTKEDFTALATLPNIWVTNYKGVNGQWFGTADAIQAANHPEHYLFLPAGDKSTVSYWTKSYNSTTNKPIAFSFSISTSPQQKEIEYITECLIRCIKK